MYFVILKDSVLSRIVDKNSVIGN